MKQSKAAAKLVQIERTGKFIEKAGGQLKT